MDKKIRNFIESPKTLELVSESCTQVPTTTRKSIKKYKKKREGKLSTFVPLKSIYEETDLSKLTERQRILAIKFQTVGKNVNSLFLAVNNISASDFEPKNEDPVNCVKCTDDCVKLGSFIKWLENIHSCSNRKKIATLSKFIERLCAAGKCICASEKRLYKRALNFVDMKCCRGRENNC